MRGVEGSPGRPHANLPHLAAIKRADGALANIAAHIPTIPGTPPTQHPKLPVSNTITAALACVSHVARGARAEKIPIAAPATRPPLQHANRHADVQLASLH